MFLRYSVVSQEIENSKVFQSKKLNTNSIIKELKSYRNQILNFTYSKVYNASENYKRVFWGWWKLLNNSEIDLVYEKLNVDFYKYLNIGKDLNRKSSIYKEIINLK